MNLKLRAVPSGNVERRPVTGRAVLVMLLAFFGAVTLVNLVMIRAAISTFGGVDTPSSYQAGLNFKGDEAVAAAQAARHWNVTARLSPSPVGEVVSIEVLDAGGKPVSGASVTARLAHPVDERRDIPFAVEEAGAGLYEGRAEAQPGQWTLDLEVAMAGERLFRSRNRVTVR